jgi:hypothetical protein
MNWPESLTIEEAMRATGLKRPTVVRWKSSGVIPDKWANVLLPKAELVKAESVKPDWKLPATGVVALLAGLLIAAVSLTVTGRFTASEDQRIASEVIPNYRSLVKTEVIAKLRVANDGDLTSEEVKTIIQQSIPVIQKHTWSPLTDRLTKLQVEGVMKKAELDAALDAVERGL